MKLKDTETKNNGLELLNREYFSLSLNLLFETFLFRVISFSWLLALVFLKTPSKNFMYGLVIISITIAVLWVSVTSKTRKSRKRLEVALIQHSIERSGSLEKIYIEWQYEKVTPAIKILSGAEPYIWAFVAIIFWVLKTYL